MLCPNKNSPPIVDVGFFRAPIICNNLLVKVHYEFGSSNRKQKARVSSSNSYLSSLGLFYDLTKNREEQDLQLIHCFYNMIICVNCGEVFRRVHWNNRGKKSIVWICVIRLKNTGLFCDARTIADIDTRLQELQSELLKLASSKVDCDDVADEDRFTVEFKSGLTVDVKE
jgi:hypothetical protein